MASTPQSAPGAPQSGAGMAGAFHAGRIAGFDIYVHWSWLIIFALFTWSIASEYLPGVYPEWTPRQRWTAGAVTSLLFFASVLAHELSHSAVARRRGIAVGSITLFIFGGVSTLGDEARSAAEEFWIAVVGPLTSFATAALCLVIWLVARAADVEAAQAIAGYLASLNLTVGVFNLLPGYPLDGGRVLRAAVWGAKRNMLEATRIAANAGRAVAGVLIGFGILSVLAGAVGGLWMVFIGWFLWNAAESSYQQLVIQRSFEGLVVAAAVERDVPRVAPDTTLRALAHDHILRHNRRAFFVAAVEERDILGLVTLADLHKVPDERWEEVSVYQAMTPRNRLVTATPRTDALAAVQLMAQHNINQLLIVENGLPDGLVTRASLLSIIQLRTEIQAMEA